MKKIRYRRIQYSQKVRYSKFLTWKHAMKVYLNDRSAKNFNSLKKISDDYLKYCRFHWDLLIKYYI